MTFCILGWMTDRHPSLVRRIADVDHELGRHSFWHCKVYEQTPESFRQDIASSLAAIRAVVGSDVPIHGIRGPTFWINQGTE